MRRRLHLPVLNLPFDRRRPSVSARSGSFIDFSLSADVTNNLKSVAARNRTSLYNVLLAAYALFLNKHTCQSDVIIGVPMAGRFEAAYERTFGLFVSSLPLRVNVDASEPFTQLLAKTKGESLNLLRNGTIGFEEIVKTVKPLRQGSAFPIYQTSFQFDSLPVPELKRDGFEAELLLNDTGISLLDLSVSLHETSDGLRGTFEYDNELFNRETIELFVARYGRVLEGIAENDTIACENLSILNAEDLSAYEQLNARHLESAPDSSLWPLLKTALETKGNSTSVQDKGLEASGDALLAAVHWFAQELAGQGVLLGTRVAIAMEAGLPSIVAQLATCCVGGVWVPIDPKSPAERLAHVLAECEPHVLLIDSESASLYGKDSSMLVAQPWIV